MAQSLTASDVYALKSASTACERKLASRYREVFARGAHPDLSMRANLALLRAADNRGWPGSLVDVANRIKSHPYLIDGVGMVVGMEIARSRDEVRPLFWI